MKKKAEVAPKKKKTPLSESKVLIMLILFRNHLNTDTLFVWQDVEEASAVVSAGLGPFQILEGASNKGRATSLQRVLVPWLISKYGMSYKSVRMEVVIQMVEAIIDRENLLGLGVRCHHARQTHGIGFNTVVRKAKLAAGICKFIHCLCIALL